ncbi:ABC transporter ATP-binding protein [Fulvimarina endophytica]|uniref:ABC transporter ATP-binding protein n=1 Tax=Fulvimarina endophytica TaxID=2293836 RepID=A0A371WZ99_9HYPH|nr:ABC transporter ATP-binding protein [Fulvimarina endophytica]RFC62320.1 ABC transporter ATP-binding protein [Fulvimarina endophytica]
MTSIELTHVTVDIPIFDAGSRSLKNNVMAAATGGQIKPRDGTRKVSIRAIDDLTLDLQHGTKIGLIGHNGAGKSTILRTIAGIYEPNEGRVDVDGSVAAMFDIGFGMDPDSTGWENIILRGMLIGFSRKEIEARAADIGEWSGLGEFLDMPLRTYSSGMSTRLAFAVSTSITPDILLIDEGIGAGDAAFIDKAKARLEEFIGNAGLLVMASHSDDLLRQWCTEGLWMEHGKVRFHGPIDETLDRYSASRTA